MPQSITETTDRLTNQAEQALIAGAAAIAAHNYDHLLAAWDQLATVYNERTKFDRAKLTLISHDLDVAIATLRGAGTPGRRGTDYPAARLATITELAS